MTDIENQKSQPLHVNKPKWLKTKIPTGETLFQVKKQLRERNLYTVCEEAKCPNISECWAANTATFMILGDTCTRACRFCNVKTGNPNGLLDPEEPAKTAESVKIMNLDYAVVTMVDRDDLPDFGTEHILKVFAEIKKQSPQTKIEFLGGDMAGTKEAISKIANGEIHVFAHNIETIKRLTPRVRDARAGYQQSLEVLRIAKETGPAHLLTKSAIMVGLGETIDEIEEALADLRSHLVDIVTIGQYMRPSKRHLSIKEFVTPETFEHLKSIATSMGFKGVVSGPLIRSSYLAGDVYKKAISK